MAKLPTLTLDPATLGDLDADLSREWLVTNGLGGYAMGSICGATTRSYHGLLVAATRSPTDRAVLITKIDETVTLADGSTIELGTNEYADGTIAPRGYERLAGFALEGSIPHFTYALGSGATLEKRVWMEHNCNLTYVSYRYVPVPDCPVAAITLTLTPFCLDRDHHAFTIGSPDWHFLVDAEPSACTVRAFAEALPYRLIAGPRARFTPTGAWYWHVYHRTEHERGLQDTEDVYQPGQFTVTLAAYESASLVLSAEATLPAHLSGFGGADHEATVAAAYERERQRQHGLLDAAGELAAENAFFARLMLAADQFLVARPQPDTQPTSTVADPAVTVIAGYPWFTDWGRDTMIALPGLTLTTGRHAEARGLLRTFARYVDQGMIPNRFPDGASAPEYNTADATLWYVHALGRYLDATQDETLLAELFPTLEDIIRWHVRGTRYGIDVDPADGLLRAGAPGIQLTWMDAKVGDWVVTPRWGKPVEINALWYAALVRMSEWATHLGRDGSHSQYEQLRQHVAEHFLVRYWYDVGGYLYDVVDVAGQPGAVDWSLRPNQLFALSLARPLVPEVQAQSILTQVERELLTPLGLRTLAPDDLRFIGVYSGDQRARDAAYHQGAVWPWLLGAYVDACAVYGDAARCLPLLDPFAAHLHQAGIGTISEIAEGSAPFRPCGCIAQAWSVAELLRVTAVLHPMFRRR